MRLCISVDPSLFKRASRRRRPFFLRGTQEEVEVAHHVFGAALFGLNANLLIARQLLEEALLRDRHKLLA